MAVNKKLDEIIHKTIEAIEQSKTEIFEIAEMARAEYARIEVQLAAIRVETKKIIQQVDEQDYQFLQARIRLMDVSRDFKNYSEENIRLAYEDAQEVQLGLAVLKEREAQLRLQRDGLERMLRNLLATVTKADNLASHVGIAMQYLQGSLHDLGDQLEGLKQRQQLGIRVIQAQEEERRRLARDIHDGPAQTLASAVLRVEICERILDEDTQQVFTELHQLKELIRSGLQDIRKIIYDLRPMMLDDLGLAPTLRRFIAEFNSQGNAIASFSVSGTERRLPTHLEVGIFRIVQEAVNNIGQHANARSAIIRLEFEMRAVGILVKDDGIGFDVCATMQRKGNHFGLLSMRERVDLLQGTWQINSLAGQGTRILIRVPIKETSDSEY